MGLNFLTILLEKYFIILWADALKFILLTTFFDNIAPMKFRKSIKINSRGKIISTRLEGYKPMLHVCLTGNSFISNASLGKQSYMFILQATVL